MKTEVIWEMVKQKSYRDWETIIRVEKDKNNRSRSIVSPKEMRGEEFDSFVIEILRLYIS